MSSSVPGSGSNFGNLASFLNSNREGSSRALTRAAGRADIFSFFFAKALENTSRLADAGLSFGDDLPLVMKDVQKARHGKVLGDFVGKLAFAGITERELHNKAPSKKLDDSFLEELLELEGVLLNAIKKSNFLLPQERVILEKNLSGFVKQSVKEACHEGELEVKEYIVGQLFESLDNKWEKIHSKCQENRPEDRDINRFQSVFLEMLKKEKKDCLWEEVMKRAGTLPKEGDVNLIKFFLQCTQEEKSSSFGLLWWPGAGDDLKRLQGLFVETCDILEERAEIEASPAFKDFQSQLKTLGRKGENINSLKSLCRSAGISSDKMGLVCGFSDPGSGRFWKGKDEDSLNVALMALKEVIASRNRSQTKEVIVSSAEQQNVSISAPLAPASIVKEIASIEKRTTIHRDRFLNLCKRVVGLVGNIPGEELHGRVEDLVFKPRTGNKREFSESVNNYLNKKLAANMRASFSTFARAFFKAEAGDLYDDKIGDLVSSKHFASVKSLWSKK